jgi:hypothetical protein
MLQMVCKYCRETIAASNAATRELDIFEPCCVDSKREISHLKAHFTKKAEQHGRWKVESIDSIGNIVETTEEDFVEPSFYEAEMHR